MEKKEIDGKEYIPSRHAAKLGGYSPDYIGQLCRAGKIEAKKIDRVWYVLPESLRKHEETAAWLEAVRREEARRSALATLNGEYSAPIPSGQAYSGEFVYTKIHRLDIFPSPTKVARAAGRDSFFVLPNAKRALVASFMALMFSATLLSSTFFEKDLRQALFLDFSGMFASVFDVMPIFSNRLNDFSDASIIDSQKDTDQLFFENESIYFFPYEDGRSGVLK